MANSALEVITGGRTPWTLKNRTPDYARLEAAEHEFTRRDRDWVERTLPPRDRLASVFFASTTHDENQPAHLKVLDTSICIDRCAKEFGNPCQRFCPANVYEIVDDGQGGKRLQINAANCVHCKACDIKDPYEIINWTTPEGGSGPNYQSLVELALPVMSEIWRPSAARVADANLTRFIESVNARTGSAAPRLRRSVCLVDRAAGRFLEGAGALRRRARRLGCRARAARQPERRCRARASFPTRA